MSEEESKIEKREKTYHVEVTGTKDKEELQRLKEAQEKWKREKQEFMEKIASAQATQEERDKYKEQLQQIAQQEFEEKKTKLTDMVNTQKNVLGAEKYDEIMATINAEDFTPEKLDRVYTMITSLSDALMFIEDKYKTELEKRGYDLNAPEDPTFREKRKSSGIVSLRPPKRKLLDGDILTKEFADGDGSSILELYQSIRDEKDPIKKRKLEKIRDELWRMMVRSEREQYEKTRQFTIIPEQELDI
jgi:hypothetical protein